MGYYACNKATLDREMEDGERVIVAVVHYDDIPGKPQRHVVKGWDENAVKVACEWLAHHVGQVSM